VTVFLVGAGPGDPGLLTVRGAEVLRRADVVVFDRLVAPALLDLIPAEAHRIDRAPLDQDEINALLIAHGRTGALVVRLKGGDPFVFGRGGEEAEALAAAGVPFEVVPGISSAIAVPAYAGIPVTHRGVSTSFTVVTGHTRHAVDKDVDWSAVAAAAGTIVVLMGFGHRQLIAQRLLAAGRAPHTPVAVIAGGTRNDQRTVRTTLAALADVDVDPPVLMVIGEVAAIDLGWFTARPLFGRTVVVTRARDQASGLAEHLNRLGASVLEVPTIDVADPADGGAALRKAAANLASYDWVVVASANAAGRLLACVRDARAFGPAKVAAVGPGTADVLADGGVVADAVPAEALATALVEEIGPGPGRVLLPRAAVGRRELPDGLRAAGWTVDVVEAYRTVPVRPAESVRSAVAGADAVTFTSSSTVTNFVAALGVVAGPKVVAIGPVTAQTALDEGMAVDAVADPHTVEGLVAAVGSVL